MNQEPESAVFGLNLLKSIQASTAVNVTGAYDPEQELWISQDRVQASSASQITTVAAKNKNTANLTGGFHIDFDFVNDFDFDQASD